VDEAGGEGAVEKQQDLAGEDQGIVKSRGLGARAVVKGRVMGGMMALLGSVAASAVAIAMFWCGLMVRKRNALPAACRQPGGGILSMSPSLAQEINMVRRRDEGRNS
jgi:hypothetical protein